MADPEKRKLIRSARLIDGTGVPPKNDIAILVCGNRIAEIDHREAVEVPPGAEVIDLGNSSKGCLSNVRPIACYAPPERRRRCWKLASPRRAALDPPSARICGGPLKRGTCLALV